MEDLIEKPPVDQEEPVAEGLNTLDVLMEKQAINIAPKNEVKLDDPARFPMSDFPYANNLLALSDRANATVSDNKNNSAGSIYTELNRKFDLNGKSKFLENTTVRDGVPIRVEMVFDNKVSIPFGNGSQNSFNVECDRLVVGRLPDGSGFAVRAFSKDAMMQTFKVDKEGNISDRVENKPYGEKEINDPNYFPMNDFPFASTIMGLHDRSSAEVKGVKTESGVNGITLHRTIDLNDGIFWDTKFQENVTLNNNNQVDKVELDFGKAIDIEFKGHLTAEEAKIAEQLNKGADISLKEGQGFSIPAIPSLSGKFDKLTIERDGKYYSVTGRQTEEKDIEFSVDANGRIIGMREQFHMPKGYSNGGIDG